MDPAGLTPGPAPARPGEPAEAQFGPHRFYAGGGGGSAEFRGGLPQSWYPPADAAALGIDLTAQPGYAEIRAARAGRMAVMRRIVASLTDTGWDGCASAHPLPVTRTRSAP